jgi:polyadenylate-binding protein
MRDNVGNSRCFGFVIFENADAAAQAVQELNGKIFNDKELYVGRVQQPMMPGNLYASKFVVFW